MVDKPLQVGIIGAGLWSTVAHIPQLRQTGQAEVVAICRRNKEKLGMIQEKFQIPEAYTDWQAMLDQAALDAVVVSTPHHLHTQPTIASLKHGLHVLVEKPMALRSDDAQAMVAAAAQAERVLMVGYNYRFRALWRSARHMLQEDVIGQLRQVNLQASLHRRWYWEEQSVPEALFSWMKGAMGVADAYFDNFLDGDWHGDPIASGGGMFSNSGSHWVDLILWLAAAPPVEIVAFGETAGMPAECFLNIQARLSNGVLVSITSADVPSAGISGQGRLTIIGERGRLVHDFSTPGEIWIERGAEREPVTAQIVDTTPAAAFIDVIQGAPNLAPAQEGAYAVAFTEAVYRSVAEKQIIPVLAMW
jgi:predicted dehydrogenase